MVLLLVVVQTVAVGVDPVDFAKMVGEAKVLISNAQDRACHFEGLSREICSQACQQLVSISQQLHQSCLEKGQVIGEQIQLNQSKDLPLQQMSPEVESIKSQLQQQIFQYENATRIVGHKDSEIQRLINESQSKDYQLGQKDGEISRLQLHCQALEAGLAASSATAVQQSVPAERHESFEGEMRNAMSTMMEAIQSFSSRLDYVESRNVADCLPVQNIPPILPVPSSFQVPPPVDPPDPGDWDDEGGDDGDDPNNDDVELVPEISEDVVREKDVVDARALQSACIDALPNNAAEYRGWKNTLILLLGRFDISGKEALTLWLSPSFQVDGEKEVESSSGLFPRLQRWLAGELIKSLKGIPEFSFRVPGYVEGCTRKVQSPRGRAILHMISRHFDLDRNRGALLTTQSIFQVTLQGYTIKDFREFSSLAMKTLNSISADDWPNERMLGEWLFHQLPSVRKLERAIGTIKMSSLKADEGNFAFLWGRLQPLLVEEREDVNAKVIELIF